MLLLLLFCLRFSKAKAERKQLFLLWRLLLLLRKVLHPHCLLLLLHVGHEAMLLLKLLLLKVLLVKLLLMISGGRRTMRCRANSHLFCEASEQI